LGTEDQAEAASIELKSPVAFKIPLVAQYKSAHKRLRNNTPIVKAIPPLILN
jgi:hypothetical protein